MEVTWLVPSVRLSSTLALFSTPGAQTVEDRASMMSLKMHLGIFKVQASVRVRIAGILRCS